MPNESWKSLVSKEWADCCKLHNLPFVFIDKTFTKKISFSVKFKTRSFYDLSKSAAEWTPSDFSEFIR